MSTQQSPQDLESRLEQAYERMVERLHETLTQVEEKALPPIHHGLEKAHQTAIELGELTREEADNLSAWIKRDLHDAGQHIRDTGHELGDWLKFDVDQVEHRLFERFSLLADRTSLELLQLREQAHLKDDYFSGEVTGPGTLFCVACGEAMQFNAATRIPSCSKCGGQTFKRT